MIKDSDFVYAGLITIIANILSIFCLLNVGRPRIARYGSLWIGRVSGDANSIWCLDILNCPNIPFHMFCSWDSIAEIFARYAAQ